MNNPFTKFNKIIPTKHTKITKYFLFIFTHAIQSGRHEEHEEDIQSNKETKVQRHRVKR